MKHVNNAVLLVLLGLVLVSCGVPAQTLQTTPTSAAYPPPAVAPAEPYPAPNGPTPTSDLCTPTNMGVSQCDPTTTPAPTVQESYPVPSRRNATPRPTYPPYPSPVRQTPIVTPRTGRTPQSTPTYEPTVFQTTTNTVIVTIADSTRKDPRKVRLRVGQTLQIKRPSKGPGWELTYNTALLQLAATTNVNDPPTEGWKWQAKAAGTTQVRLLLNPPCYANAACPAGSIFYVEVEIVA